MKSLLLFAFTIANPILAEIPKGSLVQPTPASVFKFEVVEFKPVDKHHFELNAPNTCSPGVLVAAEKGGIKCQFNEEGVAKAVLNVCDDDKAYCKPSEIQLEVKPAPAGAPSKPLQAELVEMKEELHSQLLPGFISGSPEEVLKQSQKSNQPVFLMVSTDWCPPCNQSKEYLLSTDAFKELTKDWIKVYVDGDSKNSQAWTSVVNYKAYPTMALLTPDLKEVSRFQSEFTLSEFKHWMERSKPYTHLGYTKIRQRVLARKAGSWWQAFKDFIFFVNGEQKTKDQIYALETAIVTEDQEVIAHFTEEEIPTTLRYDWLQTQQDILEKAGTTEADFNKKSLALAGLKPAYVYHLADLCKENKQCSDMSEEFKNRIEALQSSAQRTENEKLGALADEYYAQVHFYEGMELKKQAVAAAKSCVDTFEKLILASKLKQPRYGEQGLMACAKTYDMSRVDSVYRKMIERYPGDPTFVSRYARFLKDDKKDLKQAKVWAQKALNLSYDYNWFFAATLKVQIDQALGLKDQARATIGEAYTRLALSPNKDSYDQKIVARFRKLESSL